MSYIFLVVYDFLLIGNRYIFKPIRIWIDNILSFCQEKFNEALSEKVRYPVDKNLLEDPHTKANLLFQVSHFNS